MDTSAGSEHVQETNEVITHTHAQPGSTKPLHRFLRAEPKTVGIVLLSIGLCLFMFAIPLKMNLEVDSILPDGYTPFWMSILYIICGILYILAEHNTTKKMVTACFAFSIIAVLGNIIGSINFCVAIGIHYENLEYMTYPEADSDKDAFMIRYAVLYSLESVILFHSLVAGVILITMLVFSRMALRSTHTQMSVVMRYPPSAE